MIHERKVSQPESKLSLVAAFDDLTRDSRVLKESCEYEFKLFVHNQDDCRRKWNSAEQQVEILHEKVERLTSENKKLQTRLKHACSQIDYEMQKRKQVEQEKEMLEGQVNLVRTMLNGKNGNSIILSEHDRERLAFLSMQQHTSHASSPVKMHVSSASILSDISFDESKNLLEEEKDEEMHMSRNRSGLVRRRDPSAPPMEDYDDHSTIHKRARYSKDGHGTSIVTTTTIGVDNTGQPLFAETQVKVPKLNKSFSEPALDVYLPQRQDRDVDSEPESEDSFWGAQRSKNRNDNNMRTRNMSGKMPRTPSAGSGLNRVHVFLSKTFIKPEVCAPCGKRIHFSGMKCKDCKSVCHVECKDKIPLPCMSCNSTPGPSRFRKDGIISDYTSIEPPMLPALIVHCVNELESRGLNSVGMYRVNGGAGEVKELKEKFLKGKGIPNLSNIRDLNVLCSCIKGFLRELKEPIVTHNLWHDFVNTAEIVDLGSRLNRIYDCIDRLPQPNRDTLAFLMMHLIRVSESPECKMPILNLAKVFGPTIVGYSKAAGEAVDSYMTMAETNRINLVMERLFDIPYEFWQKFMEIENSYLYPVEKTPGTPAGEAYVSRLGPILTPGSYEEYKKNKVLSQTQNTPRYIKSTQNTKPSASSGRYADRSRTVTRKPSHFFSSDFN